MQARAYLLWAQYADDSGTVFLGVYADKYEALRLKELIDKCEPALRPRVTDVVSFTGIAVVSMWEILDPLNGGIIRFEKWPEGYVLWAHGEIVWKSWRED